MYTNLSFHIVRNQEHNKTMPQIQLGHTKSFTSDVQGSRMILQVFNVRNRVRLRTH